MNSHVLKYLFKTLFKNSNPNLSVLILILSSKKIVKMKIKKKLT